ncbi:MAG TPA: signal peptidase I [Acidimicrobiales bacterium]|nr:signal peptidase I [Acidimicrobiales bacterium]
MTDPGRQPPPDEHLPVTPSRGGRRRSPRMRTWIEWVAIVALALLAAFAIKTWLIQAFYIPSASMVPTLQVGDRILVNKVSYDLHDIHRGDIVVFSRPPADSSDPSVNDLVKRVVGLPGDSVSSVDDVLYVNGHRQSEPYLPAGTVSTGNFSQAPGCQPSAASDANRSCLVPRGEYWVMGDNRGDSKDSRAFGPIKGSLVVGRVVVRVWPVTSLHLF